MTPMRFYVIPTAGVRMSSRHEALGPYSLRDTAEFVADRYRAEGVACEVIESATRPVVAVKSLPGGAK